MADNHVDRPDVYAQQCVQQTGTNRPRAWYRYSASRKRASSACAVFDAVHGTIERCACIAVQSSPVCARPVTIRQVECAQISGGHGGRATPVPIPNTEVKPASADGTWGQFPWESRSPPEPRTPVVFAAGVLRVRGLASRSDAEPAPASQGLTPQGPASAPLWPSAPERQAGR